MLKAGASGGAFPIPGAAALSFSTVLRGTLTLLGSSVNLLVSDISQQLGYGSLDLFNYTLISLPVWLAGAFYLVMAPRVLLPDRGASTDDLGNNQGLLLHSGTSPTRNWWAARC